MSTARSHLERPLLVLGGLVVALLVTETALRLLRISNADFYDVDPAIGVVGRPGAEGWWWQEGHTHVRLNSQGLRDREHSKIKPPNVVRIAVLGDSYAAAFQVPIERTFWSVMARELASCPQLRGNELEVLNFGHAGYGTAQELLTLRHRAVEYSPDLVLLALFTGNDVINNSEALERDILKPYFLHRDGQLLLDDSFRNEQAFRMRRSQLWNGIIWIYNRSRVLQLINLARLTLLSPPPPASGAELGLDSMIYLEPTDAVWQGAWEVTEGLIEQLHVEARESGAELFLVTLSNGIQVHPDPAIRAAFSNRLKADDLFYPDRRIRAFAEQKGIASLSLAPILQRYAEQHDVFLHGFADSGPGLGRGHWNEAGHHLAGEEIARRLCADSFVVGSSTSESTRHPEPASPPEAESSIAGRTHRSRTQPQVARGV